jgi:hypothetical protein
MTSCCFHPTANLQPECDIEQVHEDQDPGFLVKNGVKKGIAQRFIRDIEHWVKRYKCSSEEGFE